MTGHASDSGDLDRDVRELLDAVLRRASFPGREELIRQLASVHVAGGPITMLQLRVPGEAARSHQPDGPVPGTFLVEDPSGVSIGELLIWVRDGYLDSLEYAWWTDQPPRELPTAAQIRVGD
jgi:hypothetical protein